MAAKPSASDLAEPSIRSATVDDAPAIALLIQAMDLETSTGHVGRRIRAMDAKTGDRVLVACQSGSVIGFAALHSSELFHQPGGIGRIKAFCVDPDKRRIGAGTALFKACCEFFAEHGCIRMEVTSGEARHGAHRFYQRMGMQADFRRFVMEVGESKGEG